MENKLKIPHIPFYFVRHGQTDWNTMYQELCGQDDIPLNQLGQQQAQAAISLVKSVGITKIYSSPLTRAMQTAEIINTELKVPLEFHDGLYAVSPDAIAEAFTQMLEPSTTLLIVSHGQVYRILLSILNAQAQDSKAKNGGAYLFIPPKSNSDNWTVRALG